MPILWRPNMAVGDATIDADHEHLIDLINEIETTLQAPGGKATLAASLDQLAVYGKEHFEREEGLMRRIGYPGLAAHHQAHIELRAQLGTLRGKIESASLKDLPAKEAEGLAALLRHWLLDHVFREDMQFKPFLKG